MPKPRDMTKLDVLAAQEAPSILVQMMCPRCRRLVRYQWRVAELMEESKQAGVLLFVKEFLVKRAAEATEGIAGWCVSCNHIYFWTDFLGKVETKDLGNLNDVMEKTDEADVPPTGRALRRAMRR